MSNVIDFDNLISRVRGKKLFVVCGRALLHSPEKKILEDAATCEFFSDILPNPEYEQIMRGVRKFRESGHDMILAAGGGSVIDTAKCIKLFSGMPEDAQCYKGPFEDNGMELYAIPTTAGSGSDATQFAVIYVDGVKKSIDFPALRPTAVCFVPSLLKSLPEDQRVNTMLDALMHSIESVWSVNATDESREYAAKALKLIRRWKDEYLSNTEEGNLNMLHAAYTAGCAINISRTTACHAMSYRLTKLYGIPHGAAAAITLKGAWEYIEKDEAQKEKNAFVLNALGITKEELFTYVDGLLEPIRKSILPETYRKDVPVLVASVDPNRLGNMPVKLENEDIRRIYESINS